MIPTCNPQDRYNMEELFMQLLFSAFVRETEMILFLTLASAEPWKDFLPLRQVQHGRAFHATTVHLCQSNGNDPVGLLFISVK